MTKLAAMDGGRDFAAAAAHSLVDWWRLSGVELWTGDEPVDRRQPARALAPAAEPPPLAPAPPTLTSTKDDAARFADLPALQHWLATGDDVPLARPGAARVVPRGAALAPLMFLSDPPAAEDAAAGQPIGGEAWALMQRMLAAMGLEAEAVYAASIGCFHSAALRPSEDELRRCAAIARDHVRLARPARLLLMGDAPARALLGEGVARARGRLHRVEGVPTVATFHPRWLIRRPGDKGLAWRDLLLLKGVEG